MLPLGKEQTRITYFWHTTPFQLLPRYINYRTQPSWIYLPRYYSYLPLKRIYYLAIRSFVLPNSSSCFIFYSQLSFTIYQQFMFEYFPVGPSPKMIACLFHFTFLCTSETQRLLCQAIMWAQKGPPERYIDGFWL